MQKLRDISNRKQNHALMYESCNVFPQQEALNHWLILQGHLEWFQSNYTFLENKHVVLLSPDVAHCEGQLKSYCLIFSFMGVARLLKKETF